MSFLRSGCVPKNNKMSDNKNKANTCVLYAGDVTLPSHRNYGKYIVDTLKDYKDKVALIDGATGDKVTFKEIVQQVMNVAASLRRLGVREGDVVAISSENRIEFLVTCYAVIYIGAVANFINKAYSIAEVVHTLGISRPKIVFCSSETYESYKKILAHLSFIQVFIFGKPPKGEYITSFNSLVKNNVDVNSVEPAYINDGSKTAIITYSSGTTGLPKGVNWTHRGLMIAARQPIPSDRELIYLMIAPWTNTMGYIMLNDVLSKGKTVVFLAKYSEKSYLKTVEKYRVNFLVALPPLMVMWTKSPHLNNYDLSSVEVIISGGATLESKVITEVKNRFPNLKHVIQGFGMSEATGAVTQERESENKLGSVGKVMPGLILKIADIDSRKILGPNERGEVCIKGPALFGGYVGKVTDDFDEDGFYKTGDIAYYDEEGYLFIVDRLKEIIKYKGFQVGPTELEGIILQHTGVKDVGVIGVPDQVAGELPLAFVVRQPGSNITEEDIKDFVASKVSTWKKLRGGVRFVDEIPKNASGKILRRLLQQMVSKPASKL